MAAASENGQRRENGTLTWIIIIALVLAVIVLAAFVSLHRSQVAIRIGHADRETITASIATNGKIEALRQLSGLRSHRYHGEKDLCAAGYLGEARANCFCDWKMPMRGCRLPGPRRN